MRKQTKVAAIVSAAALLVIGASMTSMASVKGTWMMVDGEWMCYDSSGDPYTDVFASSNGKDFYLGDDGYLVRSDWVEYDGDMYFVNSSGQKITNDWRLTIPYEDDEGEEEWFYFQSTGKRAENKKITYKNNVYYFDSDGIMLTGWVTANGGDAVDEASSFDKDSTYYCGEDGARLGNAWIYDVEPGTDDDDADADEYWYYLKGGGNPQTGKKNNIKGQTYIFDDEGRMLHGWVAAVESGSNTSYVMLKPDEDEVGDSIENYKGCDIYYCGDEDDGHAKKNKWVYEWLPDDEDMDDGDQSWFWFDKNCKLYRAGESVNETTSSGAKFKFEEGQVFQDKAYRDVSSKKVNSKTYWFNDEGENINGLWLIDNEHNGVYEMFYFGAKSDGSMKTGSVTISDDCGDNYKFYFNTKSGNYADEDGKDIGEYSKGAGVTGNKNNKLYYYGMLIQADDNKYQIADVDGHKFIINNSGTIQHSSSDYKEDGDVIIEVKDLGLKYVESGQWKYSLANDNYVSHVGDVDISKWVDISKRK